MKNSINIVAGENIPYIKEACAGMGNLTLLPGRSITSSDLQDTNVLLIRSITKVDETLLKGTPVEFVGSASAGVDHIDIAYLKSRNIGFTSAAGSNANSVAEYIMAALLFLGKQQAFALKGKTIGIIGVGNIGKLVKHKAEVLEMLPVLHDPPLAETGQLDHRSLAEALSCDVVTLHTPLTTDGPYPTFHMLNEQTLQWLNPSAIFINAARGEVVETQALLKAITENRIGPTIIDVWEDEPAINWDLFQAATIGTPHIAGHSLDGKANGTFMIYAALCKHLGISPAWNPVQVLPAPTVPSLTIDYHEQSDEELIQEMVTKIYDLEADYHRMQELLAIPQEERPRRFDELRKNYPVRREFHRTRVTLPKNQERLQQFLARVGFFEFSEEG
ncbi:4-phosphoerythronate dehydrogenase [uncultured Nitrospira sp.]|uniref:4-phosphoerythronate dehydrogenase n=1 Tax=uncultured Nitrospira sp. TaxID=157176 RepID=UPI00314021B1